MGLVGLNAKGRLVVWVRCRLGVLISFVAVVAMHAQQPGGPPVGSVTGHVIAQDTQKPVRFAQVTLQSVAAAAGGDEPRGGGGGGVASTRTDEEGNFTAANVAPGDYYVTAMAAGYISERALLQAGVAAGTSAAALVAQIPVVRVTADSASPVIVTVVRGAAVGGLVQWEDGSPAGGLTVRAVAAGASTNGNGAVAQTPLPAGLQGFVGGSVNIATTDDRGAFRIVGLTAGDYVVQVTIPPAQQLGGGAGNVPRFSSPIVVYSPGVFRKSEAKAVTVNGGEERNDVRMVVDLRSLRRVSGQVVSSDPSLKVASGMVRLVDTNREVQRMTSLGQDGGFDLRYVPPGSYTLTVSGASTQSSGRRGRDSEGAGVSFQVASQAVTVPDTDVTDVAVTATPVQGSQ